MHPRWWLIALVASACSERTLPPPRSLDAGADGPGAPAAGSSPFSPRSGSRLQARWTVAADGRRVFVGWFDSQLGVDCTFNVAAGGSYRCLPGGLATASPGVDFADDACTQPVVNVGRTVPGVTLGSAACAPVEFVLQYDFSGCGPGLRVFRLGREVTGGRTFTLGRGCLPGFIASGTSAFALGEEVPLGSFVEGTPRAVAMTAADSLQPRMLETADGARQPLGWQNARDEGSCHLLRLTDSRVHCVPSAAQPSTTYFSDAACTQPAVYVSKCAPQTKYAEFADPHLCPPVYTMRAVGERLSTSILSSASGGCARQAASADSPYFTTGAVVPPESFPVLETRDEPAGPLRRRVEAVPGGEAVATAWVDAARDEPCRAVPFGDRLRCAPTLTSGRAAVYADAACSRPLGYARSDRCPERFTWDVDGGACPLRYRIYAMGARYTGPVFVQSLDRTVDPPPRICTSHTPSATEVFFTLTEIPASDLPELTIVVD